MKTELIQALVEEFESRAYDFEGRDCWFARDLQTLLDYEEWRDFTKVIEKAKAVCADAGEDIDNHFVDVTQKVEAGSGVQRELKDMILTRYACCLVAQNGDPSKEQIAFAQLYFAIQIRE